MNLSTFLVSTLVVLIVAAIITSHFVKVKKSKKAGVPVSSCGCSCGSCSGCSGCSFCHK